jgi:hypothetical protein
LYLFWDGGSNVDYFLSCHLVRSPRSSRAGGAGDPAAAGADPDAVAQSYWHVHAQDKSAWTQEMDIRSPSFM